MEYQLQGRHDYLTSHLDSNGNLEHFVENVFADFNVNSSKNGAWRKFDQFQINSLSKLGKNLYLKEDYPEIENTDRKYTILIWKYGSTIYDRHIKHFTSKEFDPFEKCSVQNCEITYKDESIDSADIVIIHMHRTKGPFDLPPQEKRNHKQIWAFLTDESPQHTFMSGAKLKDFNGVFNWSMTYRMDSDIPVPYGRTEIRNKPSKSKIDFYQWLLTKKSDVLVAMLSSNCNSNNHRKEYVKELQKFIPVDVYGGCGTLKCPGHFKLDCEPIQDYIFYLSFENSNCNEYITEKLWWNAYDKKSIPIVMGANKNNYSSLLPPHSYINVDDFASPRDLATYLKYLYNAPSELEQYLQWQKFFEVKNEHGYFQTDSYHYCRVCEALNYNDKSFKVIEDLEKYWRNDVCYPAWDAT